MNGWSIRLEKPKKAARSVCFEPEDIHVMRFNESEEDFDARLESYED